jgi:hypothetical protein
MRIKTYAAIVLLSAAALTTPSLAGAQGSALQPSFDQAYAKYVETASALRAKVQQGNAPFAEQKAYFDAVLRVLVSQNNLIVADLQARQDENLAAVRATLAQDSTRLEELLAALGAAQSEKDVRVVAEAVKDYMDSYKASVRQPMLSAYVSRFATEVLQPAQKRYSDMRQGLAAARQRGMKVDMHEAALEKIRLKLYEVKGLTDDIQAALADKAFTLEQVEADMIQAQEIMKSIYAGYKDLSLKAGPMFVQ